VVLAKSTPIDNPETLLCHTREVLQQAELLKKSYEPKILESVPNQYRQYFWKALFLVCAAHDLGKVQSLFQNKILKACKREKESLPPVRGIKEIPHNIISPAFIYNQVKEFPKEIRSAIYQAIAFHHGRGKEYLQSDKAWMAVEDAIKNDVCNRLAELEDVQQFFSCQLRPPSADYLRKLQEQLEGDVATFYLLLKGLLYRADHSGSAHLPSELCSNRQSSQQVTDYLISKLGINRRDIWQIDYARPVLDQNVILQAGTGSGKTEFALYWIGSEKAFYTLPMRTSVNAMYERLKKTYNSQDIGLLHSDSAFYALSSYMQGANADDGIADTLHRIDISKQLSMPISVSTADQLFTTAFKYDGYEKIFATLSYSRLVVDEIQSYDPDMVSVILNTLVNVAKIGCKFCIITATLPKMYRDYLKEKAGSTKSLQPKFNTVARHRVRLLPKSLEDSETIDHIIALSRKHKGVLVIANTVKMAKKVKSLLSERQVPASLLHSMFTYEDRTFKEQDEKQGILKNQKGIWITTQIAEVSLDIDFDVMVTEISTIDSQVQRWGRVWRGRKQEYVNSEPNIYVTSSPSDDGHIYDRDLVGLTEEKLSRPSSVRLSDMREFEIVQDIFSDPILAESKYKSKFDTSIRMLEEYDFSVETKGEAQRLFRNISNVTVIPSEVYDQNKKEIDEAVAGLGNRERIPKLNSLYTLRKKSVAIPYYYLKDIRNWFLESKYEIIVAGMKYSSETGVELAPVPSAEYV
jgi:CRISPR-associated endonuclease/helicase Cas3